MKCNSTLLLQYQNVWKEIKTFFQRRNDHIKHFAFSSMHMKIKVEHFNDELPLKIEFIDNNVVIHVE